jgi:RNA polymerase sigma factor (sigma-70 family)
MAKRETPVAEVPEIAARGDLEADSIRRLTLAEAIATLDEREQDLIALRYGADLTARRIAEVLGLQTNAVEVALHRALARLRAQLQGQGSRSTGESSDSQVIAAEL